MKILLYNEYNQVPTDLSKILLLLQANIERDSNCDVSQQFFSFVHHQIWSTFGLTCLRVPVLLTLMASGRNFRAILQGIRPSFFPEMLLLAWMI